jgi:uncharacterized protein
MKYCILTFLMITSTGCMGQDVKSNMKTYAVRLKPHQDTRKSIMEFAKKNKIKAGCILSAVGSLEQFNLRFANQKSGTKQQGYFEIVSLTGTFSESSCHLHLSISDAEGKTIGGHLLDENLIYTTLELVMGELTEVEFTRQKDSTYGFDELFVKPRTNKK